MAFIIIIAIIIYFILIAWTWQSLGNIEKSKKIIYIIIGTIIMYILTLVIFNISKGSITYTNVDIQNSIKNILVMVFAEINGIIILPQTGKILDKINEDNIQEQELKKKLIILLILVTIIIFFEIGYMKSTQEGILKVYYSMK